MLCESELLANSLDQTPCEMAEIYMFESAFVQPCRFFKCLNFTC